MTPSLWYVRATSWLPCHERHMGRGRGGGLGRGLTGQCRQGQDGGVAQQP
jgi:hypothetical protein